MDGVGRDDGGREVEGTSRGARARRTSCLLALLDCVGHVRSCARLREKRRRELQKEAGIPGYCPVTFTSSSFIFTFTSSFNFIFFTPPSSPT